ncbi:MAG: hypothetical protein ABI406_20950, partial [Ktedonobacteraceae bacterium]
LLYMLILLFLPVCGIGGGVGLIIGFFVLIAVGIGLGMWCNKEAEKRKTEYETKLKLYNHALERWNKLYYCHRDDVVYLADRTYAPIENMMNFLYS